MWILYVGSGMKGIGSKYGGCNDKITTFLPFTSATYQASSPNIFVCSGMKEFRQIWWLQWFKHCLLTICNCYPFKHHHQMFSIIYAYGGYSGKITTSYHLQLLTVKHHRQIFLFAQVWNGSCKYDGCSCLSTTSLPFTTATFSSIIAICLALHMHIKHAALYTT